MNYGECLSCCAGTKMSANHEVEELILYSMLYLCFRCKLYYSIA